MGSCPACASWSSTVTGEGRHLGFEFDYRRCADCGSIFVDPMPDDDLLDRMYSPEYVEQHYSAELRAEQSSADLAAEANESLRLIASQKPNGRLLDVGCGAGQFIAAARAAGLRAEGHERNAKTAAMIERNIGAKVHSGELASVGGSYDVVHFADVLEHQPQPLEMLREARRLLSPDGLIVARGPLEGQRHLFLWAVQAKRWVRRKVTELPVSELPPWHVIQFSLAGWHALLRQAALSAVHESIYEVHWPAPERPAWNVKWLIKAVSLHVTYSPLGRRLGLGNRVLSVLAA